MARAALFTNRRKGRARLIPHHATRTYFPVGGGTQSGTVNDTLFASDVTDASTLNLTSPVIEWPAPPRQRRGDIARRGWQYLYRPLLDTASGPGHVAEALAALDVTDAQGTFATLAVVESLLASDVTDATGGSVPSVPLGGRSITQAFADALTAGVVRPGIFYEGEFAGGTVRLWSGVGPYVWNGQTWVGAGQLLSVGVMGETSDTRALGFEVSLTGMLSGLVSIAIGQGRQGLPGRVWLGLFNTDGSLILNPYKCFDGRLDVLDISDEGVTARIGVRYESRLIDLDRARERRYTSEDQKLDYPADVGFDYVPSVQDMPIYWGRHSPEQQAQLKLLVQQTAGWFA